MTRQWVRAVRVAVDRDESTTGHPTPPARHPVHRSHHIRHQRIKGTYLDFVWSIAGAAIRGDGASRRAVNHPLSEMSDAPVQPFRSETLRRFKFHSIQTFYSLIFNK